MENPKPFPALNEPINTPEFFADRISGTNWANGILKLNFESVRACHDGEGSSYRVAVCKVAVPFAVAELIIAAIADALEKAKTKPVDANTPPTIN
jgi:hypothetical protein